MAYNSETIVLLVMGGHLLPRRLESVILSESTVDSVMPYPMEEESLGYEPKNKTSHENHTNICSTDSNLDHFITSQLLSSRKEQNR